MVVKFLRSILGPMASKMGVGKDTLTTYLEMLKPYYMIVFVAFVLMLLIFLISFKLRKGRRATLRVQSLVAFLLVCTLAVNAVCYGPMFSVLGNFLNGKAKKISSDTRESSQEITNEVAEEGIVLLKNEDILPLDQNTTQKLNVFGWASTEPIYSGTNSEIEEDGDQVSILDSLKSAGFELNDSLENMYKEYYDGRPQITDKKQDFSLPEPSEDFYTESVMEEAKQFSDTAVIVLGRAGAEGADLPQDMGTIVQNTKGKTLEEKSGMMTETGMADAGMEEAANALNDSEIKSDDADASVSDSKSDDSKKSDGKSEDSKSDDSKKSDGKSDDTKKSDSKKTDSKSDDTKKTDSKKTDSKDKASEEETTVSDNGAYSNAVYYNNSSYDDFDEGTSYLDLSNTEELLVDTVCSQFEHVVLIVNSNNAMNLSWIEDYEQIQAVLLAPGAGDTGFSALGKILDGDVNPSGKTTDTYVRDLTTTPYAQNVGNFNYVNADDLSAKITAADETYQGKISYVDYNEGIFVGYKYYETAAKVKQIDYDEVVQYPFGYGLSYTTFDEKMENFTDNDESISFDVTVTNTGKVAGKDTVEIYDTPPYSKGGIEKSAVNLVAFDKTKELAAGESETLSFTINKEDLASYDYSEKKVKGGGYILEAGDYVISLRSDSHTVIAKEKFTVSEDITYNDENSSESVAKNRFSDRKLSEYTTILSRKGAFKNYEDSCEESSESRSFLDDELRESIENNTVVAYDSSAGNDTTTEETKLESDGNLKLYDLAGEEYDAKEWDDLLSQMSFSDMAKLINLGGWQTAEVDSVGKIQTSDCEGVNCLNNPVTGIKGTLFPTEVMMAQTWNTDLIQKLGEAIGEEFASTGNYGWYGPSLNIHRSAFAGGNYENFSEDSLLTGYMALAEVNGASSKGVYPYLKNFGLEEQETNKDSILLTFADEQTIREVYLKPFEIVVKNFKGSSLAVMVSNTWLNGIPSCADSVLLNDILRGEWGFEGMVSTDYDNSLGFQITDHCIKNGCDLMLGYNSYESNVLTESASTDASMKAACKHILYTVANSGNYANGDPYGKMSKLTQLMMIFDILAAILIILIEIIWLVKRKKSKKGTGKAGKNQKGRKKKKVKGSKKNKKNADENPKDIVFSDEIQSKKTDEPEEDNEPKEEITWIGFDDEE